MKVLRPNLVNPSSSEGEMTLEEARDLSPDGLISVRNNSVGVNLGFATSLLYFTSTRFRVGFSTLTGLNPKSDCLLSCDFGIK